MHTDNYAMVAPSPNNNFTWHYNRPHTMARTVLSVGATVQQPRGYQPPPNQTPSPRFPSLPSTFRSQTHSPHPKSNERPPRSSSNNITYPENPLHHIGITRMRISSGYPPAPQRLARIRITLSASRHRPKYSRDAMKSVAKG
jgi:hypothetical protein